MKITLIWVGKTVEPWLQKGIEDYTGRLKHYIPFEVKEIASVKNARNLDEIQLKMKEGELILSALQAGDHLVLLDENGKQPTSREFATAIDKHQHAMIKRLVFVIGGAYGFSDAVYAAAASKLSLSKMTFSHQMVRLIFTEQLYRAMTILKGEPYHHD
jgi:23S rRNA (pseudouridine1915-N3)-methyltransferase